MAKRRVAWLALTPVAVCAALLLWVRNLPVIDEEELEEVRVAVREGRAEREHQRCERSVLRGAPIESDGTSLFGALLTDTSPLHPCLAALPPIPELKVENEDDARFNGAVLHRDTFAFEPADRAPSLREARVLQACDALRSTVDGLLRHTSVCSPFDIPGGPASERVVDLVRAMVLVARNDRREGRVAEGVALLLDAVRVTHDFARGPNAAYSEDLVTEVIEQVTTSLADALLDSRLNESELVETQHEVLTLTETAPQQSMWNRALDVPSDNDPPLIVLLQLETLRRSATVTCSGLSTRQACFERLREGHPTLPPQTPWISDWLGERATQRATVAVLSWAEVEADLSTYVLLQRVEARLAGLWWVIELRLSALRTGRCPEEDTVPRSAPIDATFGGTFRVFQGAHHLEIAPPQWLTDALTGTDTPCVPRVLPNLQVPCALTRGER